MSLDEFRAKVQEYRRVIGVSQQQIARELGLNPTVLSHKLHETDGMRLTHAEVKAIVMLLAAQQAFTRRSDVAQLLGLVNLKSNAFDNSEWASPRSTPLKTTTQRRRARRSRRCPRRSRR